MLITDLGPCRDTYPSIVATAPSKETERTVIDFRTSNARDPPSSSQEPNHEPKVQESFHIPKYISLNLYKTPKGRLEEHSNIPLDLSYGVGDLGM